MEQMDKVKELYDPTIPVIFGGDFNHNMDKARDKIKKESLELKYAQEGFEYNSENRIQKRQRDGWSGISVIIRNIDGLFFSKEFSLISLMKQTKTFDELINKKALDELD